MVVKGHKLSKSEICVECVSCLVSFVRAVLVFLRDFDRGAIFHTT